MMKEELIQYITHFLLGHQGEEELNDQTDLLGSGLVDSIGMMQLIHFIEEKKGFKIPLEAITLENFMTIHAIDQYLASRSVEDIA